MEYSKGVFIVVYSLLHIVAFLFAWIIHLYVHDSWNPFWGGNRVSTNAEMRQTVVKPFLRMDLN